MTKMISKWFFASFQTLPFVFLYGDQEPRSWGAFKRPLPPNRRWKIQRPSRARVNWPHLHVFTWKLHVYGSSGIFRNQRRGWPCLFQARPSARLQSVAHARLRCASIFGNARLSCASTFSLHAWRKQWKIIFENTCLTNIIFSNPTKTRLKILKPRQSMKPCSINKRTELCCAHESHA